MKHITIGELLYVSWQRQNQEAKRKSYTKKHLKNINSQQRIRRTNMKHITTGELFCVSWQKQNQAAKRKHYTTKPLKNLN